jgi:hypothetical protein
MANRVRFDTLLAANIFTCQPVSAVSAKESNFIMLPGKTGTPPSKIEYPPLKTLSPGSQKAEEFLKETEQKIPKKIGERSRYRVL